MKATESLALPTAPSGASKIVASEIIIRHAAPAATVQALRRGDGLPTAAARRRVRLCHTIPPYVRDSAGVIGPGRGGIRMQDRRSNFQYEGLLACGRGELFVEGPQLPLPPMLMFDRISEIGEV